MFTQETVFRFVYPLFNVSCSIVYHHGYARKESTCNGFLLMSFKYSFGQCFFAFCNGYVSNVTFCTLYWNGENMYCSFLLILLYIFQWHTALKFPIFWPWNTNYISFCCPLAKFVLRLKYSLDIKWTKCWKRYWKFSCMEQYSCFWNTDPHLSSGKSFKYLNHTMLLKKLFILRDQNFL